MNKKSKVGILRWLIPVLVLLIVVVSLFFDFSNKIKKEAEETVHRELQDVAEKYAVKVDTELQYVRVAGETVAQVIKSLYVKNEETISRHMMAVIEKTGAYEAIFYEKDKKCVDCKGKSIDISDKYYFSVVDQIANETRYVYVEDDEMTGQAAVLVAVPVPDTEAVMLLFYPMENIGEMLKIDTEYGKTAVVAIINEKGEVLENNDISSQFLNENELWKNVDREYSEQVRKIRTSMKREDTGCYALKANDEERTLVYVPIGINDWVLIAGVDQNHVNVKMNRAWKSTSTMLYQLAGVLALFALSLGIIYFASRKRNAEKSKALEKKADTDLLTGLNNKLATERKIKEYIKDHPDSLAMMLVLDIDNFKKINDTMGHAFGDEVLSSLGRGIGSNFRVSDIIGRTGGDEFTIFLKSLKDEENTLKEAKKLVNFFKDFQVGEYVKYSATASIGAAVFPADGEDFETLYKAADQALYKAKKRGKNQLAFYDDRDRKS